MSKMEIGVIGLGKFGQQVSSTLTELGHRVVGMDIDPVKVRQADAVLAQAYQGDATDKALLEQLRFQDLNRVILSVGQSMEASIMITLNLTDLRVKNIIAKANTPSQRKVLQRLGVEWVIQPELDVAVQTAYQIHHPGMLDFLPVGGGALVQEVTVDKWAGKNLASLELTNKHGVMVIAKRIVGQKDFSFVPDPRETLGIGDVLVLIGKPEMLQELKP